MCELGTSRAKVLTPRGLQMGLRQPIARVLRFFPSLGLWPYPHLVRHSLLLSPQLTCPQALGPRAWVPDMGLTQP